MYDHCYTREASAEKDLNWSVPIFRCTMRPSQTEHTLFQDAYTASKRGIQLVIAAKIQTVHGLGGRCFQSGQNLPLPQNPTEHYRRFNVDKCKLTAATCHYSHSCSDCNGPHPRTQCPRSGQGPSSHARSPTSFTHQPQQPGLQAGLRY